MKAGQTRMQLGRHNRLRAEHLLGGRLKGGVCQVCRVDAPWHLTACLPAPAFTNISISGAYLRLIHPIC